MKLENKISTKKYFMFFKPVTRVIRSEASCMKKSWNSIPSKLNIKGWNWRKINNTKESKIKNMAIKRKEVKIKIKNKEEEEKEEKARCQLQTFDWSVKLKRKITLIKWQNNKDQIENNNIPWIWIEE